MFTVRLVRYEMMEIVSFSTFKEAEKYCSHAPELYSIKEVEDE